MGEPSSGLGSYHKRGYKWQHWIIKNRDLFQFGTKERKKKRTKYRKDIATTYRKKKRRKTIHQSYTFLYCCIWLLDHSKTVNRMPGDSKAGKNFSALSGLAFLNTNYEKSSLATWWGFSSQDHSNPAHIPHTPPLGSYAAIFLSRWDSNFSKIICHKESTATCLLPFPYRKPGAILLYFSQWN